MTPRELLLLRIEEAIGRRSLAFVGIRGHDAAPLLALPQFQHCFAVAAPLGALTIKTDATLEAALGQRYDLDTYDYDYDTTDALLQFRRLILGRLNEPSAVSTYRPSQFLWNIGFASSRSTEILGMFRDRQSAYEYKPWVESHMRRLGLTTVPWRYVADEARELEVRHFAGPTVLRASRTAGGTGIVLAREPQDIIDSWPEAADRLVAVGPYIEGALPINVGAVVYSPRDVRLHPGSVQLIGIKGATTRDFGYCGNDFDAFAALERDTIDEIDEAVRRIGRWLGGDGYRGAFGVDFLIHRGEVIFGEINARLQGSTAVSCALAAGAHLPDIVLDQLAATLGISPGVGLSLATWAHETPPSAHIVVHNVTSRSLFLQDPGALSRRLPAEWEAQLLPAADVEVLPGAILARLTIHGPITSTGYTLSDAASAAVDALSFAFGPAESIGGQ